MKIYKRYIDSNKVEQTTIKDLIYYCEEKGHWKEGTSLLKLKQNGFIRTPFAIYTRN
jgi:hypothetical protein